MLRRTVAFTPATCYIIKICNRNPPMQHIHDYFFSAIMTMPTCRIDISPAIIKISQYSKKPAKYHYIALKNLFAFLNTTKSEGLYYYGKLPIHYAC
jgi:hypothetical protein